MAHNPIFEELVDKADDKLLGMVAYGVYKTAKRQWIVSFTEERGRKPSAVELANYQRTWTPQLIENATDAATAALAEYASEAIDEARSDIVEEALKGTALKSVLLSMLAALLYTLFLLAVVIVLRKSGVDILSLVKST